MNAKKIICVILIGLLLTGCGQNTVSSETASSRDNISEEALKSAEIAAAHGLYAIDIYSYPELAGDADYIFVGEVLEMVSVDYRNPVEGENEDGSKRIITSPYTNYSVQVTENLKGTLNQSEPIMITKRGGLSDDGETIELFEEDVLPTAGNSYIFFVYAQDDGSNLVSGPNSSIPLENEPDAISTYTVTEAGDNNILDQVRQGIENQIVTDRERSVSKDEVTE